VIGASRAKAGTVAAIVGKYLASASFGNLADETRRTRRNILERFRERRHVAIPSPAASSRGLTARA
jgi:hypothetical protein